VSLYINKHIVGFGLFLLLNGCVSSTLFESDDWQQAAGPNGNNVVAGNAPTKFSVTQNQNILWRTNLPNTGQGTVIIKNDKAFVMSHTAIAQDEKLGKNTIAQSYDAFNGQLLWSREIQGKKEVGLSSLFSDNTAASAVASDSYVAFMNTGGQIVVFDHQGNEKWQHNWVPFGRNGNRQHEPLLVGDKLIVFKTLRDDLPEKESFTDRANALGNGKELWTHLHAFNIQTGNVEWVAEAGTSVHATSLLGHDDKNNTVIITARGGPHEPLETPYGISVLSLEDGKSTWDKAVTGYRSHQNMTADHRGVYGFTPNEHLWLDLNTGGELRRVPLYSGIKLTQRNGTQYETVDNGTIKTHRNRSISYQTNIILGDYHFFRPYLAGYIGRVHLVSGEVELLQVPIQVVRKHGQPDQTLWHEALPIKQKNSDGFIANAGSKLPGTGWGHISGPNPIAVGNKIYFPTVTGMVYAINGAAEVLDETALLAINDLGPAEETWTLSGLSYANGRLYARTLKELICIGEK
jgi:outer membrane protein assembly factor BamB